MRHLRHLLLAASLVWGGCAFGPGGPFASIDGTIASEYAVPLERSLPDGWAKLASDYHVRLTSARVGVADVELRARAEDGAESGGTFDPADPPPSMALLRLPVSEELDALAGEERPLSCEESCDLGLTTITEIHAGVDQLAVEGFVRDLRAQPQLSGDVPFILRADEATLRTATDISADRSHPPRVVLRIRLGLTPEHFDAPDWAALDRTGGAIDFSLGGNAGALDEIVDAFSATGLAVDVVSRTE